KENPVLGHPEPRKRSVPTSPKEVALHQYSPVIYRSNDPTLSISRRQITYLKIWLNPSNIAKQLIHAVVLTAMPNTSSFDLKTLFINKNR
ncbi:MAG: hypothetical protein AAFP07_11980, partial [Cyanobacteria bacterium J06606_4]